MAIGGGGIGAIGLLIVIALTVFSGGAADLGSLGSLQGESVGPATDTGEVADCLTGQDANERQECRLVATVNSLQDYWAAEFARGGSTYQPTVTNFFEGSVSTACGNATSAVGPFYCPADGEVYIDLGFYSDLERRFGASGGDFAEAYVLAHEYGHHVQNLTGISGRVGRSNDTGPQSDAVRQELQADCFAGLWAAHATTTPDPTTGEPLIVELTDQDIALGLDAASAIGDDRIQESAGQRVNPESWTHGSSDQRVKWFRIGFEQATFGACDTFGVATV
jgi:predicted metalloprotease